MEGAPVVIGSILLFLAVGLSKGGVVSNKSIDIDIDVGGTCPSNLLGPSFAIFNALFNKLGLGIGLTLQNDIATGQNICGAYCGSVAAGGCTYSSKMFQNTKPNIQFKCNCPDSCSAVEVAFKRSKIQCTLDDTNSCDCPLASGQYSRKCGLPIPPLIPLLEYVLPTLPTSPQINFCACCQGN